jgi:hypothetical protein
VSAQSPEPYAAPAPIAEAETLAPKPAVAYVVQVFAALLALNHVAGILGAASAGLGAFVVLGTLLFSGAVAIGSVYIFLALQRHRTFGSRLQVSLYLWAMLLAYPVSNVLITLGWYAPRVHLKDTELAGAALAELMRYLVSLFLIVWVGTSGRLKAFFAARRVIAPKA